ncbi:MAG: arsenate reductase (glutaredoxin) [Rhodospirillales bacterium]|nr:arsenate reductase (glutaredoxin) [Rhodospirillales bacterium]
MHATIYHNPKCGTSRNALQILHEAGVEPEIIEYLKTPLSREELAELAKKLGGASVLLRTKEILVAELGLENAAEATILDAIAAHPILLNRPLVVTDKGARFCRPAELVREII